MQSELIVKKAKRICKIAGTTNPEELARARNIEILERKFETQKGIYCIIKRNKFIFIKEDLPDRMRQLVLLHEIGHDVLHSSRISCFNESDLFAPYRSRLEDEANLFAAHILLPDDTIIDYVKAGYNTEQIQKITGTDINLIFLKIKDMNQRGYGLKKEEYNTRFLQ